jgi:uncharacterized protein YndB with AHSA1/START domain
MTKITIEANIERPIERVWSCWTISEHITKWNFASDDWECPESINDFVEGGKFKTKMAAKDGSMSFYFEGIYKRIDKYKLVESELLDGRKIEVQFIEISGGMKLIETFDAESENSEDMQRKGWQSILDNFKKYVEKNEYG